MAKFFNRKSFGFIAFFGVLACAMLTYTLVDEVVEPPVPRAPASHPDNYETLKGCEKQQILWDKVKASAYKDLPPFRDFGAFQLLAMSKQEIKIKGANQSDFAPPGWRKYLHGRAVLATAKIVPKSAKYSGIFQGDDCALLRLSLTFKPTARRGVAPGLAIKALRDGVPSANISALVALEGQGKEFNFFRYPMSNIVPSGSGFGAMIVHHIFGKVSGYPEELLAEDMARIDAHGVPAQNVVSPRQLFFVPNTDLKGSSEDHDIREDAMKIPAGTVVYQVRAVSENEKNFDYAGYTAEKVSTFLQGSEHIADIVTTSEFVASEFGDDGIFFRHELRTK